MDWKALAESVAKIGLPLLGAVLPIPGGAVLGTALASRIGSASASPDDIWAKLSSSADAVQKAKEFELTHEETILKMKLAYDQAIREAESKDLASVNATMQTEAANSATENWWQKGWRPYNGYTLGTGAFFGVVFTCYLFYKAIIEHDASAIAMVPGLATSLATILAVPGAAVGITAWHRGITQRIEAQKEESTNGPSKSAIGAAPR